MKQRLEPITEAWTSFVVEFPTCPKVIANGDEDELQKILMLCAATEKNPAELCYSIFGPQILLRQMREGERPAADFRPRLIFVYAADADASLKPTLEYYQSQLSVPVLVAQKTNLQKSAQHVMDFLQSTGNNIAEDSTGAAAESATDLAMGRAHLEPGLIPLPVDVALWSGPLPDVKLDANGSDGALAANQDITDYRAEYTCRYVLNNFKECVNRDKMAEMVHLSPGYFSNLFRLEVGMSFSDYLIQIRVDNAKKLLRRFDLSIEEISRECGFNSLAHFSRTFKDRCGMPPLKFRKSPNTAS